MKLIHFEAASRESVSGCSLGLDPGDILQNACRVRSTASSVTGISSGLEDNSSQSSTAKANLSAVESFCSSGIVSLIMSTRLPYSGPSRNWWKASRSGRGSIVFPPVQGPRERFTKLSPATYPHGTKDFVRYFGVPRSRTPQKRGERF